MAQGALSPVVTSVVAGTITGLILEGYRSKVREDERARAEQKLEQVGLAHAAFKLGAEPPHSIAPTLIPALAVAGLVFVATRKRRR